MRNADWKPLTGRKALAVELLAQGLPTSEVAVRVGVSESTIRRWARRPEVVSALRELQKEALQGIARRLRALAQHATEALGHVLKSEDTPPAVRVSSARAVLDFVLRLEELSRLEELEERIKALEARQEGQGGISGP
ncbi:MAG: helix-turn-helix domain-containing protein [Candidatus Verstraetearchaeota archaeon]|nr:helix-turn-helix domain-containing protein [Candidatus Verstraetearchaeota archaeon]